MYKFLYFLVTLFCWNQLSSQVQDSSESNQALQIGVSSGLYLENNQFNGSNVMLNFDYEINSKYTLSQSNQFAFLNQTVPYINTHLSLLLMKHVQLSPKAKFLYGTGLSYTKYNRVETIVFGSDIKGSRTTVTALYALTVPVQVEFNFVISPVFAIGVRGGTHFNSRGTTMNYSFVNPVLKYTF